MIELDDVHVNFRHVVVIRDFVQDGVPYEGQPDFKSIVSMANGDELHTTVPRKDILLAIARAERRLA